MNSVVDLKSVPRTCPTPVGAVTAWGAGDRHLLQAASHGPVPLALLSRDLQFVFANNAAADVLGVPAAALAGRSLLEQLPHIAALANRAIALLDQGCPTLECEIGFDGRHYQVSVNPFGAADRIEGMIVAATDITRRHRVAQRLRATKRRLAAHTRRDHLTQLMNRRGLDLILRQKMMLASRARKPLSVLMADIDWFKSYNDEHGHLAGDRCIRRIAESLRACVKAAGGEAARYGGEEFVAVLPAVSQAEAAAIAERFRAAVEALEIRHQFSLHEVVTVSVGVASLGSAITNLPVSWYHEGILSAADDALYSAKSGGRNRVHNWGARTPF